MTTKPKTTNKGGRPPHQPTEVMRGQVKTMAGFGATEDEISTVMSISPPTLRKHYWMELQAGRVEANLKVAQSLFRVATHPTRPDSKAGMFWLRCRAGWKEADGSPPAAGQGKKEQAQEHAVIAHRGTQWSDLLHTVQ